MGHNNKLQTNGIALVFLITGAVNYLIHYMWGSNLWYWKENFPKTTSDTFDYIIGSYFWFVFILQTLFGSS